MPMELQIIRAQEFIRLGAKGRFDLKASKAVLAQLAGACCKRGINQALLDVRAMQPGSKPMFSPNDLVMLVNTFHEVGFTHKQRLAVLYSSDPHHRARLFAFIAKLRGWKVQAFDDFEQAYYWLSAAEEPQVETEFTPRAKKVAIHRLKNMVAEVKSAPRPDIIVKSPGSGPLHAGSGKTTRKIPASGFVPAIVRKIPVHPARPAASPR
jgi:hypothetical protein